MFKSQEKYLKFKNETNALKLIAGEEVLSFMNEIDQISQISFDVSTQMMKHLAGNIIGQNLDKLNIQKTSLENLVSQIHIMREKFVKEIRLELSEI